jgi:hypothetical protein
MQLSEQILPKENRISREELKQMFMDIDAPTEIQMYFINLSKALEVSEKKWIDAKEFPPKETGRYWCNVKEQNDLGISYYEWNCSFTKGKGFNLPDENAIEVTHYTELIGRPNCL